MKKLITLIFVLTITISYAQEYPKMVVEGATWMYEVKDNGNRSYFAYHIKGDTILNGINYSILHQQGVDLDSVGFVRINTNSTLSVYMREDTVLKKVFAIIEDQSILKFGLNEFNDCYGPGDFTDEYLLYDFGQEVGDALNSPYGFQISDIQTSNVLGYQVRKFEIEIGQPFYEQFGDEKELFFPHQLFFIGGYQQNLIQYCVTDNYECEIFVGPTLIADLTQSDFSVFPNPADNLLTIKVPNEKIQSVQLLTAEGRLIYTQNNIDANDISIDLSLINYKGIINIVGITETSRFMKRLIKI